jgi:hypothetical protein
MNKMQFFVCTPDPMLPFFPTIVENVTVSHGRKAVLKCEVENLRNYKVGAKQFPSESAEQTSRITGGRCISVLGKKGFLQVPGRVPLDYRGRMYQCPREERLSSSARMSTSGGMKCCPQVPGWVPLEGRKVVLQCQEEYLWNYRGRIYQCSREGRLSSSARNSISGITEGECFSVLGKKGCPQVPGRVPLELERENAWGS